MPELIGCKFNIFSLVAPGLISLKALRTVPTIDGLCQHDVSTSSRINRYLVGSFLFEWSGRLDSKFPLGFTKLNFFCI